MQFYTSAAGAAIAASAAGAAIAASAASMHARECIAYTRGRVVRVTRTHRSGRVLGLGKVVVSVLRARLG